MFDLDHAQVQTLMYLMLAVAGSMTIFLTRTRGPFWSIPPKRVLLLAVLAAEAIATLLAGFGILMTPLGWKWVAFVWGYAIIWFLITDRVKLLGYRLLDPGTKTANLNADEPTPADKAPEEPSPADNAPPGPSSTTSSATTNSTAFYTDTDHGDPVFHDNTDCPYGIEIKNHHNDRPGTDHRRR